MSIAANLAGKAIEVFRKRPHHTQFHTHLHLYLILVMVMQYLFFENFLNLITTI